MDYRPRGRLARSLHDKWIADEYLRNYDKSKWYAVEMLTLPRCLQSRFTQLQLDDETQRFLNNCEDKSASLLMQIWHVIVKALLGLFITQTSINGLLRRGSMFVFSHDQFLTMSSMEMQRNDSCEVSGPKRLLDLGAGDGAVTAVIADLFDEVYATEVSSPMKRILNERGYLVLNVESWADQGLTFDTVLCLNLLDRCDNPLDILRDIRRVLSPRGFLLLALVLPFKPYVETGQANHMPSQPLNVNGETFEGQVDNLVHNVLGPAGWSVVRWSRVPYLCEGDLSQAYYWLDDVLLVLSPCTEPTNCCHTQT